MDIIVFLLDIELSEEGTVFQFVNEVRDEGEWVGILDHMGVEVAVVLAGSEGSIFFWGQRRIGMPGGIEKGESVCS